VRDPEPWSPDHLPAARRRGPTPWALAIGLLLGGFVVSSLVAGAVLPQRRPHGVRVTVEPQALRLMDGDTAEIRWSAADVETVRFLGIDAPELYRGGRSAPPGPKNLDPRGAEARGFARGAFGVTRAVALLRCDRLDRYRRTLGYFFLDGRNFSALAVRAGYAHETISRYGDNGLPREAAEVLAAARERRRHSPRTTRSRPIAARKASRM